MKIKLFGPARELCQSDSLILESEVKTIGELRQYLGSYVTQLDNISSYMISKNLSYANDDELISPADELALIPPVSGG